MEVVRGEKLTRERLEPIISSHMIPTVKTTRVMPHADAFAVARKRMVYEQILSRGVSDAGTLRAMSEVPRHLFVDDALKNQAYADTPLNIGEGQTISQPYIVALMTQALGLSGRESVLEIGTGCGYQTTVLAMLAATVFTIERLKSLAFAARRVFKTLRLTNVVMRVGDGSMGWPERAPFDRILLGCVAPCVPKELLAQLAPGGCLVLPVADVQGSQSLIRVRSGSDGLIREDLGLCRFVKLIGRHGYKR